MTPGHPVRGKYKFTNCAYAACNVRNGAACMPGQPGQAKCLHLLARTTVRQRETDRERGIERHDLLSLWLAFLGHFNINSIAFVFTLSFSSQSYMYVCMHVYMYLHWDFYISTPICAQYIYYPRSVYMSICSWLWISLVKTAFSRIFRCENPPTNQATNHPSKPNSSSSSSTAQTPRQSDATSATSAQQSISTCFVSSNH